MRKELQVSKDYIPLQLKEVFEIFIEINLKKGLLLSKKMISDD